MTISCIWHKTATISEYGIKDGKIRDGDLVVIVSVV